MIQRVLAVVSGALILLLSVDARDVRYFPEVAMTQRETVDTNANMRRELDALTHSLARLEGVEAVRRLQNTYGYYMDLMLYDQVVPLFAHNCEVRFMGGIYRGPEGVKRLFLGKLSGNFTGGKNRPQRGRFGEHVMLQDVISVADDRMSAMGRFRHLLKAGTHQSVAAMQGNLRGGVQFDQWIEGGIYENTFVNEDGVWKFKILDYQIEYFALVQDGWAKSPAAYRPWFTATYPEDPTGPDELIRPPPHLWPDRVIVPFHYPNPVTGKPVVVDPSSAWLP